MNPEIGQNQKSKQEDYHAIILKTIPKGLESLGDKKSKHLMSIQRCEWKQIKNHQAQIDVDKLNQKRAKEIKCLRSLKK